jgi:TetR/AcrR family transcriptional regulator
VTSRTPERVDPRRARTVAALLASAEELFRTRPLDEVTVEEIATQAGVAVGSLYNHFGSKAGLYAALVQRAIETDRVHMDLAYAPGRPAVDQLYAAADEYLAFYVDHPDYFRMLAFPAAPGSFAAAQDVAAVLADAVAAQNARMVQALRVGMDAGVLRDDLDPEAVATVLWASWNGVISLGWRPDALHQGPDELRGLLHVATDVVANGLLAGTSGHSL